MSNLAKYEAKAKTMTDASLHHNLADVRSTLAIWDHTPTSHPYHAKLLAEFDAYTVELHRRQKGALR